MAIAEMVVPVGTLLKLTVIVLPSIRLKLTFVKDCSVRSKICAFSHPTGVLAICWGPSLRYPPG